MKMKLHMEEWFQEVGLLAVMILNIHMSVLVFQGRQIVKYFAILDYYMRALIQQSFHNIFLLQV